MKKIRAVIKIPLLVFYTSLTYGIYAVGAVLLKIIRVRNEPWRNLYMRVWSIGVAYIFNIKIEAEGTPPKPPFFIVSNHLSYLDIIPLYRHLKCTFVAKKEVRSWPFLGFMVMSVGVIFVDRSRRKDVKRVNELLSKTLNKYQGLILFPEGTSSGGEDVLPFHSSLLELPAISNRPVHAASLYYETAEGDIPARDSVCFFGGRDSFTEHVVKLAQTRKVICKIRFSEEPVQSSDRKELAVKLHNKVQGLFSPTSERSS
jgi:1-acyl-sn-glycerol-3-phosphate acyltransferase